jgi:glycosyltransferase involved in cell wall biosynthesis
MGDCSPIAEPHEPRLVVLLPHLPSRSEVWLWRMLDLVVDWTVAICCAQYAPVGRYRGIPVVPLNGPLVGRRFGLVQIGRGLGERRLRDAVDQYGATAVLCHYGTLATHYSGFLGEAAQDVWVHVHGYDLRPRKSANTLRTSASYWSDLRTLQRNARYFANSEFSAQTLVDMGINRSRVVVKHLGVPVSSQYPRGPRTGDSERLRLLYLGRFVDFKGPLETLKAFEHLRRCGINATLTMAGSGPLLRQCRGLATRSAYSTSIRLLGSVEPAAGDRLRANADVFTAHNRLGARTGQVEGYGVSIVEAMAAGLPVVTGRSGAIEETVVDGATGRLFPPGSIADHAEALREVADHRRRSAMGRAAWQRVRTHFSISNEAAVLRESLGCPD